MKESERLRDVAHGYWTSGVPVVPLKGKQPLVEWRKWQNNRQTEEEFKSLPWDKADGFAVICGLKNKDGLFLGAVDFDVKNLPSEVTEKGRKALKHLPVTQMEETPSGGQHWIYLSQQKPKTISVYHNICGLELIGEGKLCIMAPSQGYKRLNDNPPKKVENLEDLLLKTLKKIGIIDVETKTEAWFNREDLARTGKPYEGKNPPCIQALMKGVGEGLRNEYAIRLASYKINFRKQDPQRVLGWLKKWNRNNQPPLPDKELEAIVKSASSGGYIYGCKDPILRKHCKKEDCPLALYNIVELLTEEEKQKAISLLKDPKILDYVVAYGRRRLIGEDNVLLINFIALCSGQTKYPISTVITGYSGSGKNESIRAVKPLIPPEWIFEFTTSTPEALKYIPEEFKGTLIAYEILGVKGESGKIALRAAGEGESIQTVYPAKNEVTGKIELKKAKTNAKNFITTSSQIEIDPDLYRRVFKITMKHDTEITKQVIRKKIHDAARPESLQEKLSLKQTFPYSETDFQNALRLNQWQHEVIVFAPPEFEQIINLAQTIEQQVTLRGQVERILNFAKILALIQQRKRKRLRIDETLYVIANPEDFLKALEILGESIIETVTHISKRHQEVLELFKNHEYLTSNKVAEELNVSQKNAWRLLRNLNDQGYLNVDTSTKPHTYTLKAINVEKKLKTNLIDQIRTEYQSFWQKELENLFKTVISSSQSRAKEQTSENQKKTDKIVELTLQEFIRLIHGDPEIRSEVENAERIRVKAERAIIKLSNAPACEDGISQLTSKKSPFEENTTKRLLNHVMRTTLKPKSEKKQENVILYRRIKPSEPCEECGQRAVEYELRIEDGSILRKCEQCFEKMRKKFKRTTFIAA